MTNTNDTATMQTLKNLAEAEVRRRAARVAFDGAKSRRARRDADEDLSFWQGRCASLQGLLAVARRTA